MTICLSGCSLVQGGKVILQDVSLQLAAGEVISVVGPNGAGKSSLVALVAATSQPSSGQLSLDGRPYGSISLAERATRVAVLPQQTSLEFPFSVAEVIQLGVFPTAAGVICSLPCWQRLWIAWRCMTCATVFIPVCQVVKSSVPR